MPDAETVRSDDDWLEAVAFVRSHYPEDVFPPEGKTVDAASARFARSLCDQIIEIASNLAEVRAHQPEDVLAAEFAQQLGQAPSMLASACFRLLAADAALAAHLDGSPDAEG
jgi:hypothetical protein